MTEEISTPDPLALQTALLTIAVESWRFGRVVDRLLDRLDDDARGRYERQSRWFQKRLESSLTELEMRIVNIEGQSFEPGMAATALNLDEFAADDILVVDQMIEPIVMGTSGVLRAGTVTLRKEES